MKICIERSDRMGDMILTLPVIQGIKEQNPQAIIHVIGIYCGVPQALECFKVARKVLEEEKLL